MVWNNRQMGFRESIADYAPAVLVSAIMGIFAAIFAFLAVSFVTAWRALGIDFAIIVGLPIAALMGIGSFIVVFWKIRP